MSPQLILASASPRRKELLGSLGLPFSVHPADIDESLVVGETPEAAVLRLAEEKCAAISQKFREALVLAADTIVVIGEGSNARILGKPIDAEDARNMLRALSGQEHRVMSATALCNASRNFRLSRVVDTAVDFHVLEDQEIDRYVRTGEPMDKAGAYGIQGLGGLFIRSIRGSYSNVVGLPLLETYLDIKASGLFPEIPLFAPLSV